MPLPAKWWRWFFSREARSWDRRARHPLIVERIDDVQEMLGRGLRVDGAVLDIGCGPGAYARRVSNRHVVGADLADGMLRRAARHGDLTLVQCDLGQGLPFRDDAFAGALALLVVQHVPDVQRAFAELRRVVVRKGALVLSVPAKERPPKRRMGLYWTLRPLVGRVPGVIHRFSADDFHRAVLPHFEIAEMYTDRGTHIGLLRNTKPL